MKRRRRQWRVDDGATTIKTTIKTRADKKKSRMKLVASLRRTISMVATEYSTNHFLGCDGVFDDPFPWLRRSLLFVFVSSLLFVYVGGHWRVIRVQVRRN
ncbi:hypothetical protein BVRB_2g047790 [Beta vulgaris subsp. vulgaris]|nr:hypothetical protein BVRB_2g047790 [Beta vulgaris subsp. vulgaris]